MSDAHAAPLGARKDERQTTGVALAVPRQGFRRDDGWRFVTVAPADSSVSTTDYVDLPGDVEDDRHAEGLNHVLLVVAVPN